MGWVRPIVVGQHQLVIRTTTADYGMWVVGSSEPVIVGCQVLMVVVSQSLPGPPPRRKLVLCQSLVEPGCSKTPVVDPEDPSSQPCCVDPGKTGRPWFVACRCGRICQTIAWPRTHSADPKPRLARSGYARRFAVHIGLNTVSKRLIVTDYGRHTILRLVYPGNIVHAPRHKVRPTRRPCQVIYLRPTTRPTHRLDPPVLEIFRPFFTKARNRMIRRLPEQNIPVVTRRSEELACTVS